MISRVSGAISAYLDNNLVWSTSDSSDLTSVVFILQNGNYSTDANSVTFHDFSLTSAQVVPIPGALLLFAPGLAGLAAIRRRFKK